MAVRICPTHRTALVEDLVRDSLSCPFGHRVNLWLVVAGPDVVAVATRIHGALAVAADIHLNALRPYLDRRPDAVARAAGRRSRRAGAA